MAMFNHSDPSLPAHKGRTSSSAADRQELSDAVSAAHANPHRIVRLPLAQVDANYLVRDRIGLESGAMETLVTSLRSRGQQIPIEVVDQGEEARPRFGLIAGWRRLQALKRIAEADKEEITILALLRHPEQARDAYLAMVEENEIRIGLSFYERARVILKAVEQGAFPNTKSALLTLFHAASRAKRSKIRSFLIVVEALEGAITFPEGLGERLGLHLAKALKEDPGLGPKLRRALNNTLANDSGGEQAVIVKELIGHAQTRGIPIATTPERRQLGQGLVYTRYDNGDVLLSGPDLSHGLWSELIDWLSARQLE